ncbi:MAG: tetratricopeptide repeat protein [Promethearchaeota archaeon]
MAIYYFLSIECGPTENASLKLCEFFKNKSLILSDDTEVNLSFSNGMDEIGNWWIEVIPQGVNYGSLMDSNIRLVDYFTGEITQQLYNLLKIAPTFRYALAGYEVEFFLLFNQLEKSLQDDCFEGMILSKELWEYFGKCDMYETFSKGYVWYPFSKKTQIGQDLWYKEYTMKNKFRINENITIRLENGDSNIFINDKMIVQKKFKSVEEEAQIYRDSSKSKKFISEETEFWGHCSNIQKWVENNYNTILLDRSIAFPILRELVEIGDLKAKEAFKDEIKKRIKSNYLPVQIFLIANGYLKNFSDEELKELIDGIKEYHNSLDDETCNHERKEISEAFRNSIYSDYRFIHRDDKRVIKLCEIAIEFDDKNTSAWYEMALSYSFVNDFDNAEKFYKRALEINPDDILSLGNLCDIYLKLNKTQDILNLLEGNLMEDIIYSQLYIILAKAYNKLGNLNKALELADISYKVYPRGSDINEFRADLMKKLNF